MLVSRGTAQILYLALFFIHCQTLVECEAKYGSYARGAQCYCTPFDGCYHSHYQVKPLVTDTGSDGLHEGKHIGIHEGDYFIEVVAINRARLETKSDFKVLGVVTSKTVQ